MSRSRLATALDRQAEQLSPVADALDDAAGAFAEIHAAQRRTIEKAHRWEFSIDDNGRVHNEAGLSLDPRRPAVRLQLEGSVVSICFRLFNADGTLAAKLVFHDAVGDLGELWDRGMNAVEDGVEWVGDKLSKGLGWVAGQWGDHVAPRLDAAGKAWDRLVETHMNPPEWLKDWALDGKPPYISQVGGHAITVMARELGVLANLVTGEDQHIADDGKPWVGETRLAQFSDGRQSMSGLNDLMEITMETYDREGEERNSVSVTAVESPDGQVRYIASIPGTAEGIFSKAGWGGAPSGLDWAANFMHIGEGPTVATQAASDAIQQAIAEDIAHRRSQGMPVPEGDPELLLTGHSQGGIIAGQMLTDPKCLDGLDVKSIVSAGSPQQTLAMDPNVPVYNFQTQYDLVPRADSEGVRTDWTSDAAGNVKNITLPHSGGDNLGNYWLTYTHLQDTYQKDIAELVAGNGSEQNVSSARDIERKFQPFLEGKVTMYKTQFGREYE
ncbi:hypothetical protein [uncultured Tessaracoccus sp.]|uniref:hypothetical protein n=1 Tax=uncultured Tessaracoccus sp. TaxID=905023 RepID=UPI0025F490B9|nr:hypothetical protein [uncultured Tessaracoccus sp.]